MALLKYLQFYLKASTKYQVHSPFVYDFVENVLEDKRQYYFFKTIEQYRKLISKDSQKIMKERRQTIGDLASARGIDKTNGQLLFRLVHHYKPASALLIGTFPGVAALYQSTPSYKMQVVALESDNTIAQPLQHYFKEIGAKNIHLQVGEIDVLTKTLAQSPSSLPYIYLKALPSKEVAKELLLNCTVNGCLVIEKPYADDQRFTFWNWLKAHELVTLSMDTFHLGFVFFRKEQKEKAHYKLIPSAYKPWSLF